MAVSTTDNVITLKESSTENTVLKEYVNLKIDKVNSDIENVKEKIKYEKELVREKDKSKNKALKHQFNETQRRLEALNHEAQRLALMIPKSEFDIVIDNIKRDVKQSDDELTLLQLWKSNVEGRQARSQLIAIVAAIIAAAALARSFFS